MKLALPKASIGLVASSLLVSSIVAQDATYAPLRRMLVATSGSEEVAAGDLDGDGDADVLATRDAYMAEGLYLYRNEGDGRMVDENVASAHLSSIRLADLDGDLDLDVVGLSADSSTRGQVRVLSNDGHGFLSEILPGAGGATASEVGVGDVDQDGDVDLYLFGRDELLLNDGLGAFAPAAAKLALSRSGALADLDGDGDLDVARVLVVPPYTIVAAFNDGAGGFSPDFSLPVPYGLAVFAADFDGNGTEDLLAGAPATLLLSGASGLTSLGAVLPGGDPIALGDVDGDGDVDVIGVETSTARLVLFRQTAHGVFEAELGAVPAEEVAPLTLFDADRDGDLDAIVPGTNDALWLNDGRGYFTDGTTASGGRVFGDLDGDGFLDSMDLDYDNELRLYFNEGTGAFRDATSELPAVTPGFPSLADFDGDGDLDVYVSSDPQASLLLNDGRGTFVEAPGRLPPSPRYLEQVAFLDLDLDGDVDLYRDFYYPHEVLLNDGTAHFTRSMIPVAGEVVRFGDVDGDRDPDVVIASHYFYWPHLLVLVRNRGDGTFDEASFPFTSPPDLPGISINLALGDLEGDGDLDVVYGYRSVFLNSGAGRFELSNWELPLNPTEMLDIDDDGDVDLLEGLRVARNEGQGRFTLLPDPLPGLPVGDLDRDGDRDLAGEYNLERALAWHSVPRLGRRLVLELYGPPREPFVLLASPVRRIQSTGLGLLQLDLEHAVRAAAGDLDAEGRADLPFEVPRAMELAGRTLYWQALVGKPARLTNLEATTFLDL